MTVTRVSGFLYDTSNSMFKVFFLDHCWKFEKKLIFFHTIIIFPFVEHNTFANIYKKEYQVQDLESVTPVKPFEATRFVPINLRKQLLI